MSDAPVAVPASTWKRALNVVRSFLVFRVRYRWVKYGRNVHCKWSVFFWSPHRDTVLGNDIGIGPRCVFLSDLQMGNKVLIAPHVAFINKYDHRYDVVGCTIWDSGRGGNCKVVVDDDVWIGHGAIIVSPLRIGRGAVIAAGSVVTHDVSPYAIVAGVPAKVVRMRFTPEQIVAHETILAERNASDGERRAAPEPHAQNEKNLSRRSKMRKQTGECQSTHDNLVACSGRHLVPSRFIVLGWCLKHLGFARTTGMVWSKVCRVCRRNDGHEAAGQRQKRAADGDEELGLQPGELVEVKSEPEIQESLDERGRHRGLLWMPSMARFCGRRYRVYKRIETMMLETTGELRKVRNTVLLENVICEDLYGCDRSCYHYWREAWLRRVPADADSLSSGGRDHDSLLDRQ